MDNLSPEIEQSFRLLSIHLLHLGGKLLQLSPAAIFTACHTLHRVFCCRSFFDPHFDILTTVMACILLAGKVEECPRRVRDVVNTYDYLYTSFLRGKKYRPFKYTEDLYYDWRDRVTDAEMRILQSCGFKVTPTHPTALLVNYLFALKLLELKDICQLSLDYLFDSTRSTVSIMHQPNVIACACIQLAADDRQLALPNDWILVFDVTAVDLEDSIKTIKSVYSQTVDLELPVSWEEQGYYVEAYRQYSYEQRNSAGPRPGSPALSYSSFSSDKSNNKE